MTPQEHERRVNICSSFREKWQGVKMQWGVLDCAQMARAFAIELGAPDLLADWPEYATKREARATLKAAGFKTFTDAITAKLEPLEHVNLAMEGDFVELKSNDAKMSALTIKLSAHSYLMFAKVTANEVPSVQVIGVSAIYNNDFAFTGNAWRVPC